MTRIKIGSKINIFSRQCQGKNTLDARKLLVSLTIVRYAFRVVYLLNLAPFSTCKNLTGRHWHDCNNHNERDNPFSYHKNYSYYYDNASFKQEKDRKWIIP